MSLGLLRKWFGEEEAPPPTVKKPIQREAPAPKKNQRRPRRKLEEIYLPAMKLKMTSKGNPRRIGTQAYNAWELLSRSDTVQAALLKGVSLRELDDAVEKGYAEVSE